MASFFFYLQKKKKNNIMEKQTNEQVSNEQLAIDLAHKDYESLRTSSKAYIKNMPKLKVTEFIVASYTYILGNWKFIIINTDPLNLYMWEVTYSKENDDFSVGRYAKEHTEFFKRSSL